MTLKLPRVLCCAAVLLVVPAAGTEQAAASPGPVPFEAHALLRAAVEADAAAAVGVEAARITEACVPPALGEAWRASFQSAVGSMLEKTSRSIQRGLGALARGTAELLDGTSCGDVPTLARFRSQARRLLVLAGSSRSLAGLDSKIAYEPLKALRVGGVDVHTELNALLVAWQLNRGVEEIGKGLAGFLKMFAEEEEASEPAAAPSPPPAAAAAPGPAPPTGALARQTPAFWVTALNKAWHLLGDISSPVSEKCLAGELAQWYSERLDAAFRRMMERNRRSMQAGLKLLAADALELTERMGEPCQWIKVSPGTVKLRSAASRLQVLAAAKSLMNFGVHVEYEALRALRIGGIDVHVELNRFIGSWLNGDEPEQFGKGLADFFDDFAEREEPEEGANTEQADDPLWNMVKDSILAAQGGFPPLELPRHCFPSEVTSVFAREVDAAIDEMLKKRMRTMQQGLKQLADATDKLMGSVPSECTWTTGGHVMKTGAKKVRKLTRKTVVDYGTHIKYEAMRSLTVGGVAVHAELNNFLAAWKLRSQAEAGTPFGQLMLKFASISGHDEL